MNFLKHNRKKARLTQLELSEMIGCHKQQINNFESGRALIPIKYIDKLAKALRLPRQEVRSYVLKAKINHLIGDE